MIKRTELWSHEETGRQLQCVRLSDRSQPEEAATGGAQLDDTGKGRTMETVRRSGFVGRGEEEG